MVILRLLKASLVGFMHQLDFWERRLIQMPHIFALISQVLFFMACDKAFLMEKQHLTCFFSLLLYLTIAYCIGYLDNQLTRTNWDFSILISEHSKVRHLALTATRLTLEWVKAVTFCITIVSLLLVLGVGKGLRDYKPTTAYTWLTVMQFAVTEPALLQQRLLPALLSKLHLGERWDGNEALWSAALLRTSSVALSALLATVLVWNMKLMELAAVTYVCIRLPHKALVLGPLAEMKKLESELAPFRRASRREIQDWDDVCAVCLQNIVSGRITSCHHIFHAECLRQCLRRAAAARCPLCKTYI